MGLEMVGALVIVVIFGFIVAICSLPLCLMLKYECEENARRVEVEVEDIVSPERMTKRTKGDCAIQKRSMEIR